MFFKLSVKYFHVQVSCGRYILNIFFLAFFFFYFTSIGQYSSDKKQSERDRGRDRETSSSPDSNSGRL